jgi:hypothetical protein
MNDRNRDPLVERFLSGAMSSSEESAFLARHGGDPEIRARIEAERTMRNGIEAEKGVLPMPPAGSRDRFIAMLDRTSKTGSIPPEPESGGSLRRTLLVIAALGFIVTLAVMVMRSTGPDRVPQSASAPAAARSEPRPDTVLKSARADTPARMRIIVPATKSTTTRTAGSSGGTTATGRSGGDTSIAVTPRATSDSVEVAPDAAAMSTSRQEKAKLPVTIQPPTINAKKPDR